jgi:DNA topoisomerase-1
MSTTVRAGKGAGPRPRRAAGPSPGAEHARAVGLRYRLDDRPGIRRVGTPARPRHVGPDGRPVRDAETLARIRSLAIPPGWRDVWISPEADGHLQATGRDERGRKQYRYHPRWRAARDETKYGRMVAFARALPRLRARVAADLARPGLPREKVLAAVVALLESTLIRVGNDEYARTNGSFGLTTLRDRHVAIRGANLRFRFRGKSGVRHEIDLADPRLARVVRRCQELPGQELFAYVDDAGAVRDVTSADVNAYLREAAGAEFTAKDFRTWTGTVLAAMALREYEAFDSEAQAKRHIVRAIESVAERLGNTPSVCRKCYVHPAVLEGYLDGDLRATLRRRARDEAARGDLKPEEAAVLALLRRRLAESG